MDGAGSGRQTIVRFFILKTKLTVKVISGRNTSHQITKKSGDVPTSHVPVRPFPSRPVPTRPDGTIEYHFALSHLAPVPIRPDGTIKYHFALSHLALCQFTPEVTLSAVWS